LENVEGVVDENTTLFLPADSELLEALDAR